jgi:hypothetical protein
MSIEYVSHREELIPGDIIWIQIELPNTYEKEILPAEVISIHHQDYLQDTVELILLNGITYFTVARSRIFKKRHL